jgi:hypothetical protein
VSASPPLEVGACCEYPTMVGCSVATRRIELESTAQAAAAVEELKGFARKLAGEAFGAGLARHNFSMCHNVQVGEWVLGAIGEAL